MHCLLFSLNKYFLYVIIWQEEGEDGEEDEVYMDLEALKMQSYVSWFT